MPYSTIQAITLDLDDTLWPVWPTIRKAEEALHAWLQQHTPNTAALLDKPETMRENRDSLMAEFPHMAHDFTFLRTEAIRRSLVKGGDDPALAGTAYEVFFEARHKVELFDDALPALVFLSARYPLIAISNGNADIQRVGLAKYFKGAISAGEFGIAKPDPRIFKAAAAAAGVSVANVLHVGDDSALDAIGALQAGMHAAWLNREAKDWPHEQPEPHHQSLRHVKSLAELCELL
jgi:FMN hydrolase / 5-amino-6-(5-phospho-D-ribitylamino)uracil phosphatase